MGAGRSHDHKMATHNIYTKKHKNGAIFKEDKYRILSNKGARCTTKAIARSAGTMSPNI